ncbi:MAG: transposase [Candidatus Doudnabacteria bacterium]|nr:transposase [Candidatus Doudnabacteria bacterium]
MPRSQRADIANIIYHVINRSNARMAIFEKAQDFLAFLEVLSEAREKFLVEVLAFCIMPNHWHLILKPLKYGELSKFMAWLTMTHTQRWHAFHHTVGSGHLYQGRYKSFPVQTDEYFIQLVRYVERNPLRAKLVKSAEDWKWGSLWLRQQGTLQQKQLLGSWPIPPSKNYLKLVNTVQPIAEVDSIRTAIAKNRPLGDDRWVQRTAKTLGLTSSLRNPGRPRKNGS